MTRTDPGACHGAPYPDLRPDCACGHPADFHGGSTPAVVSKPCSVANPDKCPCRRYVAGGTEDR